MKKYFALAALAMVAIVACNKEIDAPEEVTPVDEPKGDVTIIAQAPAETKTMIDGLNVKWAAGDHIAVFDADNGSHDFGLDSGEGTTTGAFSGSLSGKESGGWAIYPFTLNAAYDGATFTLDYPTTYPYDAVTVPMVGSEGTGANAGKYSFDHVGGAFKIQYTNVPAGATKFVFTSTGNITGTGIFDLSDFVLASNEGKVVTVTSLPSSSSLTFVIPVPAGSYSFNIKLLDSSDNEILGSAKTVSAAKTVASGHMVPMKAIKVKADKDETLWAEDFEACSADDQPSNSTATVFGGGRASYAYDGTYTKVYDSGVIGSTELLIAKSSRSETWVVGSVPTGSWSILTLTYKANQNIAIESSDVTVGDASYEAITDKYGTYTRTITDADDLASFSLTFSMTTDSNARIDDIVLTAGASAATPVISFENNTVTITCSTAGASIYYTDDGTTPNSGKTLYSSPFELSSAKTIKAIAIKDGLDDSGVAERLCTPKVATPVISSSANAFTITCATEGATIYYEVSTTDLASVATPTASSSSYSSAVDYAVTTYVKAYAVKAGYTDSDVASETCVYSGGGSPTAQTLYLESFGDNSTNNTAVASATCYTATASMFTDPTNTVVSHYTSAGKVGKNNVNVSDYTGASGKSAVWHTYSGTENLFTVDKIDISSATDISISFGVWYPSVGAGNSASVTVYYKIDDDAEQTLSFTGAPSNSNAWGLCSGTVSGTGSSLKIRFEMTTTKNYTIRVDDIKVVGTK